MRVFVSLCLCLFLGSGFAAGDEIILTTYYPSPNGRYQHLTVAGTLTAVTVNVVGTITGLSTLTASGQNPRIELFGGPFARFNVDSSGNVLIDGDLNMTDGAIVNVTTLTATGKLYSASTVPEDGPTVAATKDYVDAKSGSLDYGTCYIQDAGPDWTPCAQNYVACGVIDTWYFDPVHGNPHMYKFRCCRLK